MKVLLFIKKIFSSLRLTLFNKKERKKISNKSSKIYALERLKEIHNYDYSTFVANHYRAKNYTVWEYSKERNLIDDALNLVIKKEKEIVFVHCRSNIDEITLDSLLVFEQAVAEFLEQYTFFTNYNILYLTVCSEDKISEEALMYMADNRYITYEVLKEFDV